MGATSLYKDPKQTPLKFFKGELRFGNGYEILDIATSTTSDPQEGAYYVLTKTPEGEVTVMVGSYQSFRGERMNFSYRDSYSERLGCVPHHGAPLKWLERLTPIADLSPAITERCAAIRRELGELREKVNSYDHRQGYARLSDEEINAHNAKVASLEEEWDALDPERHARQWRAGVRAFHDRLAKLSEPGHRATMPRVTYGGVAVGEVETYALESRTLQMRVPETGRILTFPRHYLYTVRMVEKVPA